jgi:urate oxidase
MTIRLGKNNYGKSRVRLLRVTRREDRHDIKELTLAIQFEGDFDAAHTRGDNRKILPTDTMKNTVYALARQHTIETVELFCLHLIEHFLTCNPQVSRVQIEAVEERWGRLPLRGKPHPSAFARVGEEKRIAVLSGTRGETTVRAGIEGLVVMKTSKSAFEDFLKDPFTTLEDDENRILSTVLRADWLYTEGGAEFGSIWHAVRESLLDTFAEHDSKSLQHTLYAMGQAVLNSFDDIGEIHFSLPNKHFHLINLEPLGMDNPGYVYLPTDEPHGMIEATVRKD